MENLKSTLYALLILVLGVSAAYSLFDAVARTQEAREQSVIAKLELTRVGQNVRVGNSSFLKISERRGK